MYANLEKLYQENLKELCIYFFFIEFHLCHSYQDVKAVMISEALDSFVLCHLEIRQAKVAKKAQQITAHDALAEDLSLGPSTYIRYLRTACNASIRESDIFGLHGSRPSLLDTRKEADFKDRYS